MEEGVTRNELNVGEITWRNVPGQEFVPRGDHLCGVDVLMATFARKNACRVVFRLLQFRDGAKEEVRVVDAQAREFKDNSWHAFRFPAISESANRTFYFYIEAPDAEPGNAVTLWANASVSPPGCQMHVNHLPVPGSLCFRPVYAAPPVEAYQNEWEAWGAWETTARAMMDGSRSEEDLQERGGLVAGVLRKALAMESSHSVLEIGCGVGRLLREMAPHSAHVTGVDISANLLEIARKRTSHLTNIDLVHLGEKTLHEFPDRSFDRIYTHLVYFHLPREHVYDHLRETARLLAPGGRAYFDTWNLCHPAGFQRWESEVEKYRGKEKPRAFNRFHTRMEMDFLADKAGLHPLLVVEAPMLCYVAVPASEAADVPVIDASRSEVAESLARLAEEYMKSEPHEPPGTTPS